MRTAACVLALAALASADEITLKGGGRISGVAEERDDRVIIRTEHGVVTVLKAQVERIDRTKSSPVQEYKERLDKADLTRLADVEALLAWTELRKMPDPARELRERAQKLRWEAVDQADLARVEEFAEWARSNKAPVWADAALRRALFLRRRIIDPKDAEARYQLGLWARSRGLAADALILFQEAITLNPDHEFARRALGYQLHQGKWLTTTEVKQMMGLIEFEGDWMTPGAKEAILTSRTLEKERKLLDEARKKLEEERGLARDEFERQKRALDARAGDLSRQLADLERSRREYRDPHDGGYGGLRGHARCSLCGIVGPHAHPPPPPAPPAEKK